MKRTAGIFTISCVVASAVPAAAQAATVNITPAKPCYLTGETITVQGSGFTPQGQAEIMNEDASAGLLPVDAAGNISGTLTFGSMPGVRDRRVIATDIADSALSAFAPFRGTQLEVTMRPLVGRAGSRRRIRATGFPAGRKLYAHVRRRGYRARYTLGRLEGPCGSLTTRARLTRPGARPGNYLIQFDTSPRYSRNTRPKVNFHINVFRSFTN